MVAAACQVLLAEIAVFESSTGIHTFASATGGLVVTSLVGVIVLEARFASTPHASDNFSVICMHACMHACWMGRWRREEAYVS